MENYKSNKKHIACISYGKDSLAMLEVIYRGGLPLDEIITCDIYATKTENIHDEEMQKFVEKADDVILKRYGIEVKHIRAEKSFEQYLRQKRTKGDHIGEPNGFPLLFGSWCISKLKTGPMNKYIGDNIQYIGYAIDEKNSNRREMGKYPPMNTIYPLVDENITEEMAMKVCEKLDLVSPTYRGSCRDGCWFCGKQGLDSIRQIYNTDKKKWALLLKWDKISYTRFTPIKQTVAAYGKRFEMENKGLVPIGPKFRWDMLKGDKPRSRKKKKKG